MKKEKILLATAMVLVFAMITVLVACILIGTQDKSGVQGPQGEAGHSPVINIGENGN